MKNDKNQPLKAIILIVLAIILFGLSWQIGRVSNLADFMLGLAMGAVIVIILEVVYLCIRSLQGAREDQDEG